MGDGLTGRTCVECGRDAEGVCENCDAPLCYDHDSGEYDDVFTCTDDEACEARMIAKNKGETEDDE